LLLFSLNDVKAECGLHQATDLARALVESYLFELGNEAAAGGPGQFPTLARAAGILGVLLGQLRESSAGLHLLKNTFGLGPGFIEGLLIDLAVGARPWRTDQDVADSHALRGAIVVRM